MNHLLVIISALLLCGCANTQHAIEPERILPGPSEAISMTGIDTACSWDGKPVVVVSPDGTDAKSLRTEIQAFLTARYCAEIGTTADRDKWIRRFVERGVALSMRTCSLFFDTMERRRVVTSYAQTNMNIVGTAITALLAIGGDHSRSVFNVATALTLGNAWFENYKANYVMTPNLGKLHAKLRTELQGPLADELTARAKVGYESFDLALSEVYEFDQLCSHKSIILLLDRAVEAAEVVRAGAAPTPDDIAKAEAIKESLFVSASGGTNGIFTKAQFAYLYALVTTPDADRATAAGAVEKLSDAGMRGMIANLGLNQASVAVDVTTKFLFIDKLLGIDGSLDVAAARKAIANVVNAIPPPGLPSHLFSAANNKFAAALSDAKADMARTLSLANQRIHVSGRTRFDYKVR